MKFFTFNFSNARLIEFLQPFSFMNVTFNFIVFTLIFNFISVVLVMPFLNTYDELERFMKIIWPIVVFQLAALGFVYNIRRHLSEDYYKEAKEQLTKAYETLNHFKNGALDNDRLRWLTTARMLSVSIMLSEKNYDVFSQSNV